MARYVNIFILGFAACRTDAPTGPTTVAGTAVLVAPIANAHVKVTMLSTAEPEVVGDGVTDEDGNFEISLFAANGTLLVEILGDRGGSTKEPVSGKILDLSFTDRFANILASVRLGSRTDGMIISPWSTFIADRALWDMRFNKTDAATAVIDTAGLFRDHFGGLEFIHSLPIDPAADKTNGLSSGAVHGFVTCALASMGNDLSSRLGLSEGNFVNTISLTQWLSDDVGADGHFDGVGKNGPILLVEQSTVDIEFTRALLGAALGTFVTSSKNLSGIGLSDLTAVVNAITSDTSILYGSSASIAISQGAGPRIVIGSPSGGSTLKDQVLIVGNATTEAGVAGVEIYLDDVRVSGGQRQSVNKIAWVETVAVTDGFHIVKVKALDSTGQPSELSVTFSSDATPPTIALDGCTSLDDRARSQTPQVQSGTNTIVWYSPAPPDANCNAESLGSKDHPYAFHSFQQLAERAETSSSLTLVPHDIGSVVTPDADLVFKAQIFRGTAQIGNTLKVSSVPGVATRALSLSAEAFGDDLLKVAASDKLELRLSAIDNQANTGALSLYFTLDLLPSPLKVVPVDVPSSSAERIEHYSFANGNAAQAFDSSVVLPAGVYVAKRYSITNVSSRPVAFKIPLANGSSLNMSYVEWNGFVASEFIEVGADMQQATAATQESLPSVNVPARYSCYNNAPDVHLKQANLTDPVTVDTFEAGVERCQSSNDILTSTPVATSSSNWQVVVQDSGGTKRFVSPAGEYTIAAGESLTISIGFTQPIFAARSSPSCSPTYANMEYNSPFAPRQYSDFLYATTSTQSAVSFPFGVPISPQILMQRNLPSDSWSGLGWVDCSGVSCGVAGCRTPNDATILRVEGSIYNQDQQVWTSGSTFYWWRRAYREYASIALSKFTQPRSFSVAGSASISSAARVPTNPQTYTCTPSLPVTQFSVSHASAYTNPPPSNFQSAVYTKGTLP